LVIGCALKVETLEPPLREVVADLLADISEAARTMGTVLHARP